MGITITNLKITSTGGGGGNSLNSAALISGVESSDSDATVNAILVFDNDGTLDGPVGTNVTKWLTSTPDATTAGLYEIRWTSASGLLTESTSLTQNVWYPLSTGRSFTISGTQGASNKTSTFAFEIRLISEGSGGISFTWTHTSVGSG